MAEQSKASEEIINTFTEQLKIQEALTSKRMTTRRTAGQRQSMAMFGDADEPVYSNDFAETDKQRDILESETFKGILRIIRDH